MNAAVTQSHLTLLERTDTIRTDFLESLDPIPETIPAWYVTSDQVPCLKDRLSVKVVAWFRGQLVTGSYTKVHGSRPTFVFSHVLLPELVVEVTCWQYWDVFVATMTDCMSAARAAKHTSGAVNGNPPKEDRQLRTGTC